MTTRPLPRVLGLAAAALLAPSALADAPVADCGHVHAHHGVALGAQPEVRIRETKVAERIWMLEGQGGNIGLLAGDDGAIVIDAQFAELVPRILAKIGELTDAPLRFLVNTHWHFDHTGGNQGLAEAGAVIVAHENVRARMSVDQFIEAFDREVPAAPAIALPSVTFTDGVRFHWNGEDVRVIGIDPAHTDGDCIVHFATSNVIHAGDVFFNGFYPFIDVGAEGSIEGMIRGVDRVLAIARDDTTIIPGHGPLATVDDLRAYRGMLVEASRSVARLMGAGRTREQVIAAKPTASLDAEWGDGFLPPDQWVGIVYDGFAAARTRGASGAGANAGDAADPTAALATRPATTDRLTGPESVTIEGLVRSGGRWMLPREGRLTLLRLLEAAQVSSDDPITVIITRRTGKLTPRLEFDLADLRAGLREDVVLRDGDLVEVR